MFKRLMSGTPLQKTMFLIPVSAFVTSVFKELEEKRIVKNTKKELEYTNSALDFLNKDVNIFGRKSNVYMYLKRKDEELAFKVLYNLMKNEKCDDTIKKEDIELAISSLEEEKKKQEVRINMTKHLFLFSFKFESPDYNFSMEKDGLPSRIFGNFLFYTVLTKLFIKQFNGFFVKGIDPFSNIRGIRYFPFLSVLVMGTFFRDLMINVFTLSNFAIDYYTEKSNKENEKEIVSKKLKKLQCGISLDDEFEWTYDE